MGRQEENFWTDKKYVTIVRSFIAGNWVHKKGSLNMCGRLHVQALLILAP